jgi:hypothetical protein
LVSPSVPSSQRRGARLVELTKRAFPAAADAALGEQHALARRQEIADQERWLPTSLQTSGR